MHSRWNRWNQTDNPFSWNFPRPHVEGIRPTLSAAQATPASAMGFGEALHRQLARPLAAFYGALGLPPTLQSLVMTLTGMASLAGGHWILWIQGVGFVYLGFLLHRADRLLWERKGRPPTWNVYLASTMHRMMDGALYVGLALTALLPLRGLPWPSWQPLPPAVFLVLCAGALALLMVTRAAEGLGTTMILRAHLLATRRVPGPMALPRFAPARPFMGRFLGRDETILFWCTGLLLGQAQLVAMILLAANVLHFVETLTLFRLRLRDPEVEASRILGPDYP